MENQNNIFIETWKKTIKTILESKQFFYEMGKTEYTLSKKSNDIRELASKQLKLLDDTRPNKEESLYKQCNEKQKEFIDYLEKVILYGNIEGKENYEK